MAAARHFFCWPLEFHMLAFPFFPCLQNGIKSKKSSKFFFWFGMSLLISFERGFVELNVSWQMLSLFVFFYVLL